MGDFAATAEVTRRERERAALRRRGVTRNSAFSICGQAIPAIAALFAVPRLIHALGAERFGFLTVAWMLIGYFGVLDLGMGRALTQLLADMLGRGDNERLGRAAWTAVSIMLLIGAAGMLLLLLLNPLVCDLLKMTPDFRATASRSLIILATVVPVIILNTGFRAMLEAQLRFDLTNIIGSSVGVLTFLVPVLILSYSTHLPVIMLALAAVRTIGLVANVASAVIVTPFLRTLPTFDGVLAQRLLGFGGWITVSSIISPLMVSGDRFIIGSVVSLSSVAFYTTPFEAVTKLLLLPSAIGAVLFPTFAIRRHEHGQSTALLFATAYKIVFILMFPAVLLIATFAPEVLQLWVGADYASRSAPVARMLAIGVLVNGLASVPYALLQGAGKPVFTAVTHLLEAAIYFPAAYFLIKQWGIYGAAAAWVLRVTIDWLSLNLFAFRSFDELRVTARDLSNWLCLLFLPLLCPFLLRLPLAVRGLYAAAIFLGFVALASWIVATGDPRLFAYLRPVPSLFMRFARHSSDE